MLHFVMHCLLRILDMVIEARGACERGSLKAKGPGHMRIWPMIQHRLQVTTNMFYYGGTVRSQMYNAGGGMT